VKSFWASWSGEPFFDKIGCGSAKLKQAWLCSRLALSFVLPSLRTLRGNKASVRSGSADGIPKFWSDEKICGRLPSSPPTESPWRHLTFPPSAVALHVKTALTMKHKGWLQRKESMLMGILIWWNCKCNLQLHQALQFQHSFTKSPQASSPKCEPAIVERMRNHERLSLWGCIGDSPHAEKHVS